MHNTSKILGVLLMVGIGLVNPAYAENEAQTVQDSNTPNCQKFGLIIQNNTSETIKLTGLYPDQGVVADFVPATGILQRRQHGNIRAAVEGVRGSVAFNAYFETNGDTFQITAYNPAQYRMGKPFFVIPGNNYKAEIISMEPYDIVHPYCLRFKNVVISIIKTH